SGAPGRRRAAPRCIASARPPPGRGPQSSARAGNAVRHGTAAVDSRPSAPTPGRRRTTAARRLAAARTSSSPARPNVGGTPGWHGRPRLWFARTGTAGPRIVFLVQAALAVEHEVSRHENHPVGELGQDAAAADVDALGPFRVAVAIFG